MAATISRGLTCLALCGLFAAGTAAAPARASAAPAPEQVTALTEPSLVQITTTWQGWVRDETGQLVNGGRSYSVATTCSGFVVDTSGYVVTSANCLATDGWKGLEAELLLFYEAADQALAEGRYPGEDRSSLVDRAIGELRWAVEGQDPGSRMTPLPMVSYGTTASGELFPTPVPAQVIDLRGHDDGDVGLLRIAQDNLSTLPLAAAPVASGTEVFTAGLTDAGSMPVVLGNQVVRSFPVSGKSFLQLDAVLTEGTLGGPALDANGNVIGVNSTLRDVLPTESTTVSSVENLQLLLTDNGVAGTAGPVDARYRAALAAFYAGRCREAVDGFEAVLAVAAAHPQALDHLARARQCVEPEPEPEPGSAPVGLVALAVGGGLVAVGGVVALVLVLRRRPAVQRVAAMAGPGPGWPTPPQQGWSAPPAPGGWDTPQPGVPPSDGPGGSRVCPRCARPVASGTRFCPDCGIPMGGPR